MIPTRKKIQEILEPWCHVYHPDFNPGDPRWQALTFEDRRQYLRLAEQLAQIERGFAVRSVMPSSAGPDCFHYSYTVGLDPALMATGISNSAEPILSLAVDRRFHANGEPFEAEGVVMVFASVPVGASLAWIHQANSRQVMWRDDDGHWPWDHGHARMLRLAEDGFDAAPILAGDDWRPGHA